MTRVSVQRAVRPADTPLWQGLAGLVRRQKKTKCKKRASEAPGTQPQGTEPSKKRAKKSAKKTVQPVEVQTAIHEMKPSDQGT